jgi:hypothetical protein
LLLTPAPPAAADSTPQPPLLPPAPARILRCCCSHQPPLLLLPARFYARPLAELITSRGREILQSTVDLVNDSISAEVIYGDTDSIMINSCTEDLQAARQLGMQVGAAGQGRVQHPFAAASPRGEPERPSAAHGVPAQHTQAHIPHQCSSNRIQLHQSHSNVIHTAP